MMNSTPYGPPVPWRLKWDFLSSDEKDRIREGIESIEDPVKRHEAEVQQTIRVKRDRYDYRGRFEELKTFHIRGVLDEDEKEELIAFYRNAKGAKIPPDLLGTSRKEESLRQAEKNARTRMEEEFDYWKRIRAEQGWMPTGGWVSDRLATSRTGRLRIKPGQLTEDVVRQILVLMNEGTVNVILEQET